ncbi:PHP domain-containing protein [Paraconexibacter algicola]|uniref:PHP domain-containing protein n=1 Tax=Paraconexibacter algicola TaxID=2133960 RepID=UPI001E64148A|nr:PHP domain-containing protein [Paraconexibacter algicola]
MSVPRLTIAHVTPYPWDGDGPDTTPGAAGEVGRAVARTTALLARRGHRVLVVAPSTSAAAVRTTRRAIRAGELFAQDGTVAVAAVGEVLTAPGPVRRSPGLPVDVARTVEELLGSVSLDICHVHEPFAPSVPSVALRHSRALNVGTFHAPTERHVATQVTKKLVERVFGRLDARLASFQATAELMGRHFPGRYEVVHPGADPAPAGATPRATYAGAPVRLLFVDEEERGALRLFLRALRRLDTGELAAPWEAVVVSARGPSSSTPLRHELRERVRFVGGAEADAELAAAHVLVCASDGGAPAPGLLLRGLAAGAVPVASRLPAYEELTEDGAGLLFEPRDVDTLAAQLQRLVSDAALLARVRGAGQELRDRSGWERVTDDLERVYGAVVARRHDTTGDPEIRRRLQSRPLIDVDLHMHTDHSHDCATPVEVLLATARDQGLGAIAVTDHNEISGALDAAEKCAEYGVKVIVAEEVKTANQGEVIGLFLTEKIPRGLTLEETVAEIKRQGGLVYVPHPFDRMHAVPDYEHLLTIVDDVDALEIFNPRVAIGSFNEEAERFAAKYRIVAAAGSDSHVAQGLGTVRIRMRDFDGPQEFLESLRDAEIHTRRGTLLYVQALKFLETKATPPAARKARRARRVERARRS